MATTVVYPSIDVSGTGSISTLISTAGTFAGSLTASTFAVTGTATFSGTAVFLTTAQFLGTVTFSATVAFLTSVQISGTASIGTLVVSGTTTLSGAARALGAFDVSGTISIGSSFRIDGHYSGMDVLGSASVSSQLSVRFSGSWTAYGFIELYAIVKTSGAANTASLAVYTDGGTTPILQTGNSSTTMSTAEFNHVHVCITNGQGIKAILMRVGSVNTQPTFPTATANTGIINCVQFAASATMSSGTIQMFGRRQL